jgi:hypothetical protein
VPGNSYAGGIVAYATGCTGYVTTTASFGPSTYAAANTYCNDLVSGGYSDWTLPNITVLGQMHANRTAIGGFANNVFYWSSTLCPSNPDCCNSGYAFGTWTPCGGCTDTQTCNNRGNSDRFRCVRAY